MRARAWIGAAALVLAGGGCPADDDIPPDTGDGAVDDGMTEEDGTTLDDGAPEVEDASVDDGPAEADDFACPPSDHLACMEACAAPMTTPNGGVCVDGECRCDLCDDTACYSYCGMHFAGGRNTSRCVGNRCQCSHEDPAWDADAGVDDADVGVGDEGTTDADEDVE
ncbi:MAG: hypothetical protein HY905_07185 [Deltaproteobacteria bacterium]|nr:hypothetical protein [Deltaproteobacteria bacterium]